MDSWAKIYLETRRYLEHEHQDSSHKSRRSRTKSDVHVNQIVVQIDVLSALENDALTWSKMVRIVALMRLFAKDLKAKIKQRKMMK